MEKINCGKHGINHIVLCCQHLSINKKSDTLYLVPEEDDEEATIWCHTCEMARIKDEGWFDYADSIANWKLICSSCLEVIIEITDNVHYIEGQRTL